MTQGRKLGALGHGWSLGTGHFHGVLGEWGSMATDYNVGRPTLSHKRSRSCVSCVILHNVRYLIAARERTTISGCVAVEVLFPNAI
jgi:hypothetical protein